MKIILKKTYYWKNKPPEEIKELMDLTDPEPLLESWEAFRKERKGLIKDGKVMTVSVSLITPNKAFPRPLNLNGGNWCPYCGILTRQVDHSFDTQSRACSECGISDNDFYVRKYNRRP